MKYIIGIVATLLLLLIATYVVLGFWGISMFDSQYLTLVFKTVGVLALVSVLLVLIVAYFFRDPHKGYDMTKGNVAHPKK